ncbi:unnamed protein product, partial [marine sediment metagenome]
SGNLQDKLRGVGWLPRPGVLSEARVTKRRLRAAEKSAAVLC